MSVTAMSRIGANGTNKVHERVRLAETAERRASPKVRQNPRQRSQPLPPMNSRRIDVDGT